MPRLGHQRLVHGDVFGQQQRLLQEKAITRLLLKQGQRALGGSHIDSDKIEDSGTVRVKIGTGRATL